MLGCAMSGQARAVDQQSIKLKRFSQACFVEQEITIGVYLSDSPLNTDTIPAGQHQFINRQIGQFLIG